MGNLKSLLKYLFALLSFFVFSCGQNEKDAVKKSDAAPEENRFTKVTLAENLEEPMEMAIAPDGKVFFVERKGTMRLYDPQKKETNLVLKLNVFYGFEDGLLGLALDPHFEDNNYVYVYYSPAGDIPKQHVSRFTFKENQIDSTSEKIILVIPTQREQCCHSAGSLTFGPDDNLYIAVGDNTFSRSSEGYTPLDERPGRSAYDSQKSASNTHDLRGKILRIHPEADGSYTIPSGNLFPQDGSKGKPEIYAMGCRNPYRISVDPVTGFVYWGDVGPDGDKAGPKGPLSYDEINVAIRPGNFGWPYFVADNKPYAKVNFETNEIGPFFDPKKPVNNSVNNTGAKILPPAQGALIWYPYVDSPEFPLVGKGGRSSMAGPVYHYNSNLESEVKFPKYYDNKFFIYEWMRDWVMAVDHDKDGKFKKMEPFMPNTKFAHPIEMELGPDGALYLLEYGYAWFQNNAESKLVRIEYAKGNRPPVAVANASVKSGSIPLRVKFDKNGTYDFDKDSLVYEWRFTGGRIQSRDPNPEFIFQEAGIYNPSLTVTDPKGRSTVSTLEIKAGNSVPEAFIEIDGNRTFYWDDSEIKYKVDVKDKEDGRLQKGQIDPSKVFVFMDYMPMGEDIAPLIEEENAVIKNESNNPGKQMIALSDCKSCHLTEKKSVGPSFKDVALRYKKEEPETIDKLADKIIKGGAGIWGEHSMSAHPQLSKKETVAMVKYILTLDNETESVKLPVQGSIKIPKGEQGFYRITVSYTDKPEAKVGSMSVKKTINLLSPLFEAENYQAAAGGIEASGTPPHRYLKKIRNNTYAMYKKIDLTDISSISYAYSVKGVMDGNPGAGGNIEMHIDSTRGPLISTATLTDNSKSNDPWAIVSAEIKKTEGQHDLYLVFKNESAGKDKLFHLNYLLFRK